MKQTNSEQSDILFIERVLYALWAPSDVAPDRPAEMLNDASADRLTVDQVICARRALDRLQRRAFEAASESSSS